jgi:light-regulated signal transduction histidine kinase (bacteriophytochrome)
LLAILEYLREKQFTAVQVTQDVSKDFPDIDFAPGFSTIAGFLTVPLSREGKDFIVFCRKGQLEHIRWAGNPDKQGGGGSLEPRKSFKVWEETVVGKCKSWTDEQMDTPQTLLLIYGKFIVSHKLLSSLFLYVSS